MIERVGTAVSRVWISIAELESCIATRGCVELWLAPRECETHARLTVPKRRREWLAGRVAAKELVRRRHRLGMSALRRIAIEAPQEGPNKGKPFYRIDDALGPFDLSISHSGDVAIAALAAAEGERIGIDVEQIAPREESFEELALSRRERDAIAHLRGEARSLAVTERWVLKEALAKALGTGLRLHLEQVTVHLHEPRPGEATFELHGLHAPRIRGEVDARVACLGGTCIASVVIRPPAT